MLRTSPVPPLHAAPTIFCSPWGWLSLPPRCASTLSGDTQLLLPGHPPLQSSLSPQAMEHLLSQRPVHAPGLLPWAFRIGARWQGTSGSQIRKDTHRSNVGIPLGLQSRSAGLCCVGHTGCVLTSPAIGGEPRR